MNKILNRIEEKIEIPGIIGKIVSRISNSDLNSFYLELFRKQSERIKPADLLRQFDQNRFTLPAEINTIGFKEYEVEWLKSAQNAGFQPIQLSPVAPLGSCSAFGLVNQNNIVSATRGTEVVSDATNVLALRIASEFKKDKSKRIIKYCTTHRHTRGQYFTNPAFTAHFGVFCMVTGGLDTGNHSFEHDQLNEHLQFYCQRFLQEAFDDLIIKVYWKNEIGDFQSKLLGSLQKVSNRIQIIDNEADDTGDYYQTVRIKVFLKHKNHEIDLADMGFVDWTQKLLNNKKQRLLISGAGLELAHKIKSGTI